MEYHKFLKFHSFKEPYIYGAQIERYGKNQIQNLSGL